VGDPGFGTAGCNACDFSVSLSFSRVGDLRVFNVFELYWCGIGCLSDSMKKARKAATLMRN